ncbi:type II secretion system minor pseudopilin GspK [Croceicoccus pelagius]|nr:type II secretion system minor pseudopilin GspK [Croceicoccus pelagius]
MRRGLNRWMRAKERGAALLSVLLLVAVMAVIAAVMLERLNLATRLAVNSQAMAQARLYAFSAESIVASRLGQLVAIDRSRTIDPGGMLDRETPLPLARGMVTVRVRDAGNCFNVNSLVSGEGERTRLNLTALEQFRRLMDSLEVPPDAAVVISDSVADWIDADQDPQVNGAEDAYYQQLAVPYRTAGRRIVDLSELRAMRGMEEPIYQRLRPWLCALPGGEGAKINLNTLRPDQARLVAALTPGTLGVEQVRALLDQRPATGWATVNQAVGPLANAGAPFGPVQLRQLAVTSRWFEARFVVRVDSIVLEERAIIDAGLEPSRVVARSWGEAN